MKRNVDLTLNRKFSSNNISRTIDIRTALFKAVTDIKFPWVINMSKTWRTIDDKDAIVLTGNKQERRNKKREREYMNNSECECCGAKLNTKPWTKSPYTVCNKCNIKLNEDAVKTYWQEQNEMRKHSKAVAKVLSVTLEELDEMMIRVES